MHPCLIDELSCGVYRETPQSMSKPQILDPLTVLLEAMNVFLTLNLSLHTARCIVDTLTPPRFVRQSVRTVLPAAHPVEP